jgi:hypothetical protein
MDRERWRRIEELYDAARSMPPVRWIGTASPGGRSTVLTVAGSASSGGRLSPDARWFAFAYSSNESGALNVYVTSIDGSTTRRISSDGGTHPRWRRDGGEILNYAPSANALMSVPMKLEPSIASSAPVRLFATCLNGAPPSYLSAFELTNNDTTLWLCPRSSSQQGIVTVALGWNAALAR